MKKMTKRTLSLLLVVAMICSLGVMALADDTNKTITVNPTSQIVYAGATTPTTVTATVTGYDDAADTVTWAASSNDVSLSSSAEGAVINTTNGTITTHVSSIGKATVDVTPVDTVDAAKSVTITATLNSGTKTANCAFSVQPDSVKNVVLLNGTAAVTGKSISVTNGSDVQLSATVNHMNGTVSADAVWTTSNSGVANVSGAGRVTGSAVGTARITATAGGQSAYVDVNVIDSAAAAAPTIITPAAATTYYVAKGNTAPNLTVSAVGSGTLSYQWYSKASTATAYSVIKGATGVSYTPSETAVGTTTYYCTVTNTNATAYASANTPVYTVTVKDVYDVTLTGSTSVNKGSSSTMTAYVVQNTVSNDNKLTQMPVPSGTMSWSVTDSGSYLSFNSAKAANSATSAITNGYAYVTVYGYALKVDGVTLTASYTPVTNSAYSASQTVKVVTSSVNAAATVPAGGSAFAMTDTNGYTASSVESQLTSGISGLSYVIFNTAAATGTGYGTFSAVNGTAYYVGSTWFYTNLSSVTFTPGSTAGTFTVPYTAYNNGGTALTVGTLTITVKDAATGTGDISYNVKAGASVSLTDSDFETWYESQTSASYSLISVRFNSLPSAGTMKYSGSSSTLNFNTSTDYYTSGNGTGLSPKYLANVSYTAPSTAGNYAVSFTCTGKYGSSTRTVNGTLLFCVNKGTVADISYKVVAGQNLSLAESDFTSVYKTATSSTATSPKFTIRFVSVPSKGTLYRDGYTTSGYKVTAGSTSYYVNAAIATAYDVDDLTYVPGNYTTGSETIIYQAYDAAGTLQYTGNIIFTYTTNTKAMSCYSEGYTFAKGDFVSSSDTDPVSYVTFTGIGAGGSLYRDYNYGKGYSVGTSMKFYMSSSVSGGYPITSLTFIPKAEYIGNVAIKYTAVTKAGKTSTGTINMYCDARTSALKFNDVNASWAVPAVDFTSCWGLVTGSGGGTFNPTGTMQRAMLVTILYRMAGSPSVAGMSNPFKDVPAGTWYTNAVIWASHNGVVNGTGKTTFSPTNPVARQDIAAILWRYEGQPSGSSYALNGYADAGSVSSYAKSAMQWAVGAGIITGSGSRLNPQASGTRAEVCVMLYRLLAA